MFQSRGGGVKILLFPETLLPAASVCVGGAIALVSPTT